MSFNILIIIIVIIVIIITPVFFLTYLPTLILSPLRNLVSRRNRVNRARLLSLIEIVETEKKLIIGFFHPYCNAGGGGERVLWTAVALHQRTHPHAICAIYMGDVGITKAEMLEKVKLRFGIHLDPNTLLLIPLKFRYLVESSTWPRFTLLGQSIGSLVLGYEALRALIPDIYIDTMGYAFTFPVFRLLSQVPIGAYVHYPTISTDMLDRVSQRNSAHNNSSTISNSIILSYAKLIYYKIFAEIYSVCLNQADHLMVNSTWTQNHIEGILKRRSFKNPPNSKKIPSDQQIEMKTTTRSIDEVHGGSNNALKSDGSLRSTIADLRSRKHIKDQGICSEGKNDESLDHAPIAEANRRLHIEQHSSRTRVVFPPCDVESFINFPLRPRCNTILSISQFRPEKDQKTQIESFAKFLSSLNPNHPDLASIKLVLAGSCRDHSDEERVLFLKELARQLGVADHVEFHVNVSWLQLKLLLSQSLVGLSTMVDEHFGISIVEFMASGLIPLAHRSGGPLLDIIVPIEEKDQTNDLHQEEKEGISLTGFHANGVDDYSTKLIHIFQDLDNDHIFNIQANARKLAARKFSVRQFEIHWSLSFQVLLHKI